MRKMPKETKEINPTERDAATARSGGVISFEEFRLVPVTRTLTKDGTPVHLGARALDILIALIERAGQIISSAELVATVWPNTSIEESGLRVHIAALRRALGDGQSGRRFILSIRGRGYMFAAEVEQTQSGVGLARPLGSAAPSTQDDAPIPAIRIIEREEIKSDNRNRPEVISFGQFRLFAAERLLEEDGRAIPLGGRALDILIFLAKRAGEVVSKRDLVAGVWADVNVDEGSLRFHMAALRKALGDGQSGARYVINVQGRGYCLVAPASRSVLPDMSHAEATILPRQMTGIVGRHEAIQQIAEEISAKRFVSVVGPGGIGKTTVAVAVAHRLLAEFDSAVHFLDLSVLHNAQLISSALASALGLVVHSHDPLPSLISFLRDKKILLVLDSCEHLIEGTAGLSELIFKEAPAVHILATSRESLRTDGEHVYRLFPLDCPPESAGLKASDVLTFSAVQLFVERVVASNNRFELSDADAPLVAEICSRLDGIALAIELASGRVNAFGIQGTAALLNSRFELLWQGKRTALPRHQTLSAALGWSYDLLSQGERAILRRLTVFVGGFTLEAVRVVVADDDIDEAQVANAIADLVEKSLISSDIQTVPACYRLLDTTRAYILEKPIDRDQMAALARRHARFFCQCLTDAEHASEGSQVSDGFGQAAGLVANVRAALEWCFGAVGDRTIGISLAAASARFFLRKSLLIECHHWCERALLALDDGLTDDRREMELQAAFGVSRMFTQGNKKEVEAAYVRGLELADLLRDSQYQLRLLSALHIYLTRSGDFRGALMTGQRCESIAATLDDPPSLMVAGLMSGAAHHFLGNQAMARAKLETALQPARLPQWGSFTGLGYDPRVIAIVALARTLWLSGCPDQATKAAKYAIEQAESLGQPLTLGISLVWNAYVFLWTGDWQSAHEIIERLVAHADRHSLGPYQAVGRGLRGELSIKRGDPESGLELVRGCLQTLHESRHLILSTVFASDLAEGLAMVGKFDEALVTVDRAIAQVGDTGDSFDMPEMLRIKGDILSRMTPPQSAQAEDILLQSLDLACRQSALGWRLRTAMCLARLWIEHRAAEAVALLVPIYEQFNEGFDTQDVKATRMLIKELRSCAHGPASSR
jgi:predicted ATPase/DNA-binding response OmpR family regulator